jgi:2-iminobutanoate/2-iminopropanoate deaminase
MEFVFTENAPRPAGHYSQAARSGGWVFVSGQLPIDPVTGRIDPSITEQTGQVLDNLENILVAAGSKLERVIKVTVYISDISLWGEVNEVYAARFGAHRPARAVVPTRELPRGSLIELEVIAEAG